MKLPLRFPRFRPQSTSVHSTPMRFRPTGLKQLLVLGVLALLGNVGFFLARQYVDVQLFTPRPERSEQIVSAIPFGTDQILAATVGNDLALLERGLITQQQHFDTPIAGMAVLADQETIAVGTSGGIVALLNPQFQTQRELTINRRVIAVRPGDDGGVLVASGIGAFSDRYFIEHFAPDAETPSWSTQVEFTVTDMQVAVDRIVYSTANARVGSLAPDGTRLWTVTLRRSPTQLLLLNNGDILIGDERGTMLLLDTNGNVRWQLALSRVQIQSLYATPDSELLFAGDTRGSVFVVSPSGELRLTQSVATTPVKAFIPRENGEVVVLPGTGTWQNLQPAAVTGKELAERVRLGWTIFNTLLVVATLTASVLTVERWHSAIPLIARRAWRKRGIYLFVAPSLVLISLFSYYPAAVAFFYSFTNFRLNRIFRVVGLENYQQIFFDDFYFWVGFGNMLIFLITGIIKSLGVPLLVAELVFWLPRESHRYFFRTLFILPAVVPSLVGILLWRMIYDPVSGLLNQSLRTIGLATWQRAWLGDEHTALWAIIAAGFPWIGAFPFLIYLGGLLTINAELYDAARVDGANWWTRFWMIDLPLLKPQTGLLLFFTFVGSVQSFGGIYLFTGGGPGYATSVPALQMYKQIAGGEFGYASAIGVILFSLIIVGTVINLRFRRSAEVI